MTTHNADHFWEWWKEVYDKDMRAPLVRWNSEHTKIVTAYADYCVKTAVQKLTDEALNSGDGSYRP